MNAAAPQDFHFGRLKLSGYLESFTGTSTRRFAKHTFAKRKGDVIEDMERSGRRLEVTLQFIGPDAAERYEAFSSAVDSNPYGQLTHPIGGSWYAFCEGPDSSVDFNRATNQIQVRCAWSESELDAVVDVPDVATAAHNVVGQSTKTQGVVAEFMLLIAKAEAAEASARDALDSALSTIDVATAPIDLARTTVSTVVGSLSDVVGAVTAIQVAADLLVQDVANFVTSANDIFDGLSDVAPPGYSDSVSTYLGVVESDTDALEAALIAASPTSAGAGDAVGSAHELLDACYALSDAVAAAQPPVVDYVVPQAANILVIAANIIAAWGLDRDALEYASAILGLNRVPNPASVPAGTELSVPAR